MHVVRGTDPSLRASPERCTDLSACAHVAGVDHFNASGHGLTLDHRTDSFTSIASREQQAHHSRIHKDHQHGEASLAEPVTAYLWTNQLRRGTPEALAS
ncbi:hypothetical protein GCM10010336_03810 [Streptomyces goshikiensis]|nr:hypothetical protein GCM10010336_03810 [Streptomyces goshikiensis]